MGNDIEIYLDQNGVDKVLDYVKKQDSFGYEALIFGNEQFILFDYLSGSKWRLIERLDKFGNNYIKVYNENAYLDLAKEYLYRVLKEWYDNEADLEDSRITKYFDLVFDESYRRDIFFDLIIDEITKELAYFLFDLWDKNLFIPFYAVSSSYADEFIAQNKDLINFEDYKHKIIGLLKLHKK